MSDADDIRDLKLEVARLTKIVEMLAKQAGLGQGALLGTANGPSAEIIEEIRRGNKIGAIKLWRAETNASLLEAKNAVEALERSL